MLLGNTSDHGRNQFLNILGCGITHIRAVKFKVVHMFNVFARARKMAIAYAQGWTVSCCRWSQTVVGANCCRQNKSSLRKACFEFFPSSVWKTLEKSYTWQYRGSLLNHIDMFCQCDTNQTLIGGSSLNYARISRSRQMERLRSLFEVRLLYFFASAYQERTLVSSYLA